MSTIPDPGCLGSRIRKQRKLRKWTIEDLSERCGYGKSYLSKVERGVSWRVSDRFILAVANALGTNREALLTGGFENNDPAEPARPANCRTTVALMAVAAERGRQEMLLAAGKFPWNCAADWIGDAPKLAVLMEEVGEAAREIVETPILNLEGPQDDFVASLTRLRTELIQVAAVATAWVESLERQIEAKTSGLRDQASGIRKGGLPADLPGGPDSKPFAGFQEARP